MITVDAHIQSMGTEVTTGDRDETSDRATTDGEDADSGDGPLVTVYRRYVGEPESRREVYVGFGPFFAGVALGLIALVVFLYSGAQPSGSETFWQFRRAALVFGMLALPAIAASVPVLLPVGRSTLAAGLAGVAICVVATLWLTQVYPYQWTSAGNDVRVITTYAVGLVLLAASMGSALVAQYVESVAPGEGSGAGPAAEGTGASTDSGESVTDEQVEEDIEAAMSDSSLTWGGVEQEPTTTRLELNMPDVAEEGEIDSSSLDVATETRSSSGDVDDAVDGLRQLQGGDQKTARTESPDDAVDALTEFRRQREDEDEIETGVESDRGVLARMREKLFGP